MLDFFEQTFITFFNMTLTGSYIILAIILIRLLLKKAPKIFSYCLWLVAGIRLICPFSFSSVLSIFNFLSVPVQVSSVGGTTVNDYVPNDIGMMKVPEISTGIDMADTVINPVLPAPQLGDSANPMQIIMAVASVLWVVGIVAMSVYGVVSLVKVNKKIEFATKLDGNIFESDKVRSPFVFGIFKPKIYLPCGMDEKQREYVILHEKNHIRRFDHITKLVSFAVLMLHWYNPLVWIGYNLMVRDMEMSCDERVLRKLGEEEKKSYGLTLVAVGANRRFAAGAPLSFGENVVEKRIVNVLKFKKPKMLAVILCVILCVAVGVVCLTNSVTKFSKDEVREKVEVFIEDDWQKQVEENDYYKYEINVAGAEVVEISEDKRNAYGWQRLYHFSSNYWALLKYEQNLNEESSMIAFAFKAELDGEGNVVSVTNYENDDEIPEFLRYTGSFDDEIFERAKAKAADKFKEFYKLLKTYEVEYTYASQENAVVITGCEAVTDHFGKPYLVIRAKNDSEDGAYHIDSHFELLDGASGVNYEPRHPSPVGETVLPSGQSIGKEVLYFADLSIYIDGFEKESYVMRIFVSDYNGEYKELMLAIKVGNASSKKPQLTYDELALGHVTPITDKIKNAVSGVIYPGSNYNNFINLTAEELDEIVKCYNKTKFTKINDIDINYGNSIYVVIDISNGEKRSFTITSGGIVEDSAGNCYETNNMELLKLLWDVKTDRNVAMQPDKPTSVDESVGYTEITTAPQMIKPPLAPTTVPYSEPKEFDRTPRKQYVVSDISVSYSDPDFKFRVLGIEIPDDEKIELSMGNWSGEVVFFDERYEMQKSVNGEWKKLDKIRNYEFHGLASLGHDSVCSNTFFASMYFNGIDNGRYQMIISCFGSNGIEADAQKKYTVTVEFTVNEYMITYAELGKKIEGTPISVSSRPQNASSMVFNLYTDEEMQKIARLYNSLELEKLPRGDMATNQLFVTIIDDKGNGYYFEIELNGSINWEYYAETGAQLYDALQKPALNVS
ncbi:MAG: hypothetical protein IJE74_10335 [Clostridia bacterium]|nr:hypothetical protein [Clostridia bacterium]